MEKKNAYDLQRYACSFGKYSYDFEGKNCECFIINHWKSAVDYWISISKYIFYKNFDFQLNFTIHWYPISFKCLHRTIPKELKQNYLNIEFSIDKHDSITTDKNVFLMPFIDILNFFLYQKTHSSSEYWEKTNRIKEYSIAFDVESEMVILNSWLIQ